MKKIIDKIIHDPSYNQNLIYYISKIDDNNGFLLSNNSIWFISNNLKNLIAQKKKTQCLNLITNLYIKANEINSSFADGNYNVIELTNYEDEEKLDIFVGLCKLFAEQKNYDINDFFNSLIDLFRSDHETNAYNLIGLFGELYLIRNLYISHGINLSFYWHSVNSNDKHDITLNGLSIEVKTTIKPEMVFLLKHDQIFTSIKVIVALLRIYELPNGICINDLLKYYRDEIEFSNNLDFQIALTAELMRIKNKSDLNKKFGVTDINYYLSNDLTRIENIPINITKLSYHYDFSGEEKTTETVLIANIKSGLNL